MSFNYGTITTFYIINNMSSPTPPNFVEHIIVNSSRYPYENPNLSNVFFMTGGINLVPSWLQSGNSNQAFNTSYWLRINQSIPAHDYMQIYMDYATIGTNILNNYSIGEAPQLTNVYGLYDDGAHIFNFYDNFAGTKLNTSKWLYENNNYKVDNGITFTASNSYITSRSQYGYPSCVEAYGIMNSPKTNGSTSYDLGGVGFGGNGLDYTYPVMTSGWAENQTNGLGLTVYNSSGPFEYNYSKSIDTNAYNIFGTGFINDTYTRGTVNNIYQNSSSICLNMGSRKGLNITLGFQSNDFPAVNNFRYIMEFNLTPQGRNLPYSFILHNVDLNEEGLPSCSPWSYDILNVFSALGNNGETTLSQVSMLLPNGVYNYTVYSDQSGYQATSNMGTFTVANQNIIVNISFTVAKTDTTFLESGLPDGTQWSFNIFTNSTNFTTYETNKTSLTIPLQNGTYTVDFKETANMYVPLPNYTRVLVNGQNRIYRVIYDSPANQSLLDPLKSFNPSLREMNNGYNNILTGGANPSSLVLDSSTNVIFSIIQCLGVIVPYNISSGVYMKNITLGSNSFPACGYYDHQNGYLYVSNRGTGNLTIIDAQTLSIIKNITLPSLKGSDFAITQSTNSRDIYIFGFNNTNSDNGTSFILSNTGEILTEHNYTGLCPQNSISGYSILLLPTIYRQDLLIANGTGIDVLNLSSGQKAFYAAPKYYCTDLLVAYGQQGKFIVSNEINNTNLIFNATSSKFCSGPTIPGEVLGGYFDPLNGYLYVSSESTSLFACTGNITIINTDNGQVKMSLLTSEPQSNIEFSPTNQSIFGLNHNGDESIFHSYAVTKGYNVTFEESGLPANETWYLNITGIKSSGALISGSIYSVNLIGGNYSYTVGTADKKFTSIGGNISVNSVETVQIKFSSVNYPVNFIETGLGSGISWSFIINGSSYTVTGSEISLTLPNGSYNYNVNSINGYSIRNKAGPVNVYGKEVSVYIEFIQLTYKVTFSETGLSNGTTWEVTLNGLTHNVTGSSISLYLPNGTYTYSLRPVSGYTTGNKSGNITISGKNTTIEIKFSKLAVSTTMSYIEIGVVAAVVVAVVALFVWRKISK
ncbi:hypothetical protein ACNF42_00985 [Cuniculiplasma sp. SKW3]|uniref:hypothetical protein n=1 Tax=Cuniculiplasma sp. SKW3 TaxID=3400170 RepID=UPI003FD074A7